MANDETRSVRNDEATVEKRMHEAGIDVERSKHILAAFNRGDYDGVRPLAASGIPEIDGTTILDRRGASSLALPERDYRARLAEIAPEIPANRFGTLDGDTRRLDDRSLRTIGILLYPYLSYGVLNGGSATSYADTRKNRAFDADLFGLYRETFDRLAEGAQGKPKGITPAFINPDGSDGASFLELKFRMVLRAAETYRAVAADVGVTPPTDNDGAPLQPGFPIVEMTSIFTQGALHDAYAAYRESPLLRDFPDAAAVLETASAAQPLIAALTHSEEGRPKRFFLNAGGEHGRPLGLPGGHGQNFQVLTPVYRSLHRRGKRFVYLGNVDNVGFTVDPVSLAILALRGAQGGFDFSFRTPVDVKIGILVYDQNGRLNCGDIGPAISRDEMLAVEKRGTRILCNCASGLFNLDYLAPNVDRIVAELPMRISDQDKDAGRYSQAEQVTWEIIGMLDDPLIFGIDKYRRFLAAKMLLETILTSGVALEAAQKIQSTAPALAAGLRDVLQEQYGLAVQAGRWRPSEAV